MNCMSLWLDYDDPRLFGIAKGHGAVVCRKADGWRIDADTPEQLRDILQDYCRAKIDAKNIEAGQPLWVDVAGKAQEVPNV